MKPRLNPGTKYGREEQCMVMWINHLALLPGDPSTQTSFNAIYSRGGLAVQSTTTGELAPGGGSKLLVTVVQVPPGFLITGVRICFQNSNPRSFISSTTLDQMRNPPTGTTF